MNKSMLLIALSCATIGYGQIGISDNAITMSPSEILKVESSNKGVLIPGVFLEDLNLPNPISNPAPSLAVFNTNKDIGEGLYLWINNRWDPLVDSRNVYAYAGIVRTEMVESTAGITDSSVNGAATYTIGESPSAHDWQLIPGMSKTIDIVSANNNVSVSVGGLVQADTNSDQQTYSYAIGIFVDGKLAAVRNFILSGSTTCLYSDFNVFMTASNLSVDSHTIEVYETYRVDLNNKGKALRFGEKVASCNNISTDMSRSLMHIQISEKPN